MASFTPTVAGTYSINITMENEFTEANPGVSTNVVCDEILVVEEPPTIPGEATIEFQTAGEVEINTPVTLAIQTRSFDGVARNVTDDVFTVTLTCNDEGREIVYTVIADHISLGLYSATFVPTQWCDYLILITMENANTLANSLPTTVNDEQTITVVDNRSVPAASPLV